MVRRLPVTGLALAFFLGGVASLPACAVTNDSEAVQTAEARLEDACKAHRDLLQAALVDNGGNDYEIDSYGSINHGRKGFNRRDLGEGITSNGRACADCHMASDNFQLSPASVKARWNALQTCRKKNPSADDPLFRAIDADDFRVNGANASKFSNLVDNGLVRITFTLPPNIRLAAGPCTPTGCAPLLPDTQVDVWRAVPTVQNVKLTGSAEGLSFPQNTSWLRGPNLQGGYQVDGRASNLQEQALGALFNHAQVSSAPSQGVLDEIAGFETNEFSSAGVRAMSGAIDQGAAPVDPDPVLTADEAAGKVVFQRACAQCHGGPAQSNPGVPGIARYGSVQAQCPRPADNPNIPGWTGTPRWQFKQCATTDPGAPPGSGFRNTRWYEITRPNGEVVRRPTSDPGRTLLTGFASLGPVPGPGYPATGLVIPALDDWLALDVPQIRNLKNTAPYFHNNSAATIDDMLDHYVEFFKFVAAIAPRTRPDGSAAPRPPPISTDGVNDDRPFTAAERPALKAYLLKL